MRSKATTDRFASHMTTPLKSPKATARDLSMMLNTVFGEERFPVNIEELAIEYSRQRFPDSPITKITPGDLPGFDDALAPNSARSKWQIIYNRAIPSSGRIRFTLAHEFGHYLLHRHLREEFVCSQVDMETWDAEEAGIENEADIFASTLLMPYDDFSRQVLGQTPSFDLIKHCAERYDVSLTAAALKWVELTPGRALVLAARDDHVLWARANDAAYQSGVFLASRKKTIAVPAKSILHTRNRSAQQEVSELPAQCWFPQEPDNMPLTEMSFAIDQYGYTLAFLLLPEAQSRAWHRKTDEDDEIGLESTIDRFERRGQMIVR